MDVAHGATGLKLKQAVRQTSTPPPPTSPAIGGGLFLEVSKAFRKEQRGLCLPPAPPSSPGSCPILPGPEDFVELIFMQGCLLPGRELPLAWVKLATGRGPGWEDGREGGTPEPRQ